MDRFFCFNGNCAHGMTMVGNGKARKNNEVFLHKSAATCLLDDTWQTRQLMSRLPSFGTELN